ncbi:MAG TPA: hypothetical protein VKH83_11670, partial [Methylomirabilota bacterium]|nr:hypothetical protein [Methylomirabilota bacterium]
AAPATAVDAARHCFDRALEIAREQEATSLELRGAMSLARLPLADREIAEARARLQAVYASFTEGFETRDLENAKALLSMPAGQASA